MCKNIQWNDCKNEKDCSVKMLKQKPMNIIGLYIVIADKIYL